MGSGFLTPADFECEQSWLTTSLGIKLICIVPDRAMFRWFKSDAEAAQKDAPVSLAKEQEKPKEVTSGNPQK